MGRNIGMKRDPSEILQGGLDEIEQEGEGELPWVGGGNNPPISAGLGDVAMSQPITGAQPMPAYQPSGPIPAPPAQEPVATGLSGLRPQGISPVLAKGIFPSWGGVPKPKTAPQPPEEIIPGWDAPPKIDDALVIRHAEITRRLATLPQGGKGGWERGVRIERDKLTAELLKVQDTLDKQTLSQERGLDTLTARIITELDKAFQTPETGDDELALRKAELIGLNLAQTNSPKAHAISRNIGQVVSTHRSEIYKEKQIARAKEEKEAQRAAAKEEKEAQRAREKEEKRKEQEASSKKDTLKKYTDAAESAVKRGDLAEARSLYQKIGQIADDSDKGLYGIQIEAVERRAVEDYDFTMAATEQIQKIFSDYDFTNDTAAIQKLELMASDQSHPQQADRIRRSLDKYYEARGKDEKRKLAEGKKITEGPFKGWTTYQLTQQYERMTKPPSRDARPLDDAAQRKRQSQISQLEGEMRRLGLMTEGGIARPQQLIDTTPDELLLQKLMASGMSAEDARRYTAGLEPE